MIDAEVGLCRFFGQFAPVRYCVLHPNRIKVEDGGPAWNQNEVPCR